MTVQTVEAGSPRYIELLADVARTAELNSPWDTRNHEDAALWYLFDDAWEQIVADPTPGRLTNFSAVGLALLCARTGTPVPALAAEQVLVHIDKNAGYAGIGNPDPWANFRLSTPFGVAPATGVLIRLSDKYIRTQNLRRNPDNNRVNENLNDTLIDAIAYPLIARCLLEEAHVDGGLV